MSEINETNYQPDLNAAQQWIATIRNCSLDQAFVQNTFFTCIHPKQDEVLKKNLPRNFPGYLPHVSGQLIKASDEGYGIYAAPNEITGGHRYKEAVTKVFPLWTDLDDKDARVIWTPDLIHELPLRPTMITSTGGGHHLTWCLVAALESNEHEVKVRVENLLRGIRESLVRFGADKKVVDCSRVLRVPGFFNTKEGRNMAPTQIIYSDGPRYTLEELEAAFPPVPDPTSRNYTTTPVLESDIAHVEEQERDNLAIEWLRECPPSIQNHGGDAALHSAALGLAYLGIDETRGAQLLGNYFNPRCCPPWGSSKLDYESIRACTYAMERGNFGYRLLTLDLQAVSGPLATALTFGPSSNEVMVELPPGAQVAEPSDSQSDFCNPEETNHLIQVRTGVMNQLVKNKDGSIKDAGGNLVTIMQMDPWFQDQFSVNEMTKELLWKGKSMEAYDMSEIQQMLLRAYGLSFPISSIEYECRSQGERRLFNPVRDYFSGLKWDGVSRFQQVLTDVLHVEASELHLSYLKKLMTAVVMRTFQPGGKFDSILVLVSPQGKSKGRFYEVLGGEWYGSPDPSVINSTDAKMAFHMSIINEIQEVDKMTGKMDARNLKSLLSTREDIYRVPYGRKPQVHKRKFVLVGSANEPEGLLVDHTGNRRWWIIQLPDDRDIDVDLLKTIKDQLWAEAVELYRAGFKVYLDEELDEQRKGANSFYEAYDPYMDLILAHLPAIEENLKWNARKGVEGISMLDVMTHMQIPDSLKVNGAKSVMRMVGPILGRMGWTKKQYSEVDSTSGKRIGPWRWSPPHLQEIIDRKDRYPVQVPNLMPLPPLPGATSAN
jgi:predicted P-loop ATPase